MNEEDEEESAFNNVVPYGCHDLRTAGNRW